MSAIDEHAGTCEGQKYPARHRWNPEHFKRTSTGTSTYVYHRCLRCERVRLTIYTMTGNHVAGYFTGEP